MDQDIFDFLEACREQFDILNFDSPDSAPLLNERGLFLRQWAEALEAYGTPASFALGSTFTSGTFSVDGKTYERMVIEAKNNAQRRELMARQAKYSLRSAPEEYGGRKDFANCFLCENVGQVVDASIIDSDNDYGKNNLVAIISPKELLLLPNRYPAAPGHSLTVPYDHDDMSTRQKDDGKRPRTYIAEQGKTRGAVLSRSLLELTGEACEKYGLVAMRNHVLDGMSIPGHDHFHAFPEELPWVSLADRLIETRERAPVLGAGIYLIGDTPWDTLAIAYDDRREMVDRAIPILAKMEEDSQVFTLILRGNTLLIGPRWPTNTYQQVGAGMPIHYFDTATDEFLARAADTVPKKGEYQWEGYV